MRTKYEKECFFFLWILWARGIVREFGGFVGNLHISRGCFVGVAEREHKRVKREHEARK